MCGIVSILAKSQAIAEQSADLVQAQLPLMLRTLDLRGPDEQHHQRHGMAWLGHTRLSIIDLAGGSQPIFNEDGTIGTVFNGEIYNFLKLRRDLKNRGHVFRTNSDTEVIVHLYEEYGEGLFAHLNGMFAIALFDTKTDTFLIGRDRLGEKPVIYRETEEHIFVASEMKALLAWQDTPREVDPEALALYLNFMCVPAPLTIFRGIKKLPPAHYLKHQAGRTSITPYWQPDIRIDWSMTEARAVEEFQGLFAESVRNRIISDVPLGVFLSGGVDSSAVTAFTAQVSDAPVNTFCAGFADGPDERPYARLVADRYGTNHHELHVKTSLVEAFEAVMDYFDEPFADSSSIPTYLVSKAAKEHVTVVLTGDGGDELFGGYDAYIDQKYLRGGRVLSRLNRIVAEGATRRGWRSVADTLYPTRSGSWQEKHWHHLRSIVPPGDMSLWLEGKPADTGKFFRSHKWLEIPDRDALSVAFSFDLNYYLPDDLLKKVDMASMLSSLECRAPFLDHHLVEFSLRIPPTLKLRGDSLKHVLKQSLAAHLPQEILYRSKQGFGAPVLQWINGPLKELSRDLLRPGCRVEQLLDGDQVRNVVNMADGRAVRDFRTPFQVWEVLVLEWWLRKYL